MRRLLLPMLLLATITAACNRPGLVQRKLVTAIRSTCKQQTSCTIRMSDVTTFDWDKFAYFGYQVRRKEIEDRLGVKFTASLDETKSRLVFVKNAQVVYYEEEPTDVEHPIDQEVWFEQLGTPNVRSSEAFSRDATFQVETVASEGIHYYVLRPVTSLHPAR